LINHNTPMTKIFNIPENKTCGIFDATYRFAQKSKNFGQKQTGQKQLWSEQKKYHS